MKFLLLILCYLPLWAVVAMLSWEVVSWNGYFSRIQHNPSLLIHGIATNLFLAFFYMTIHLPLLLIIKMLIIRNRTRLIIPLATILGAAVGMLEYISVQHHMMKKAGPIDPRSVVVFVVTSTIVGYLVGFVISMKPLEKTTNLMDL